jgi:hypothetical protein
MCFRFFRHNSAGLMQNALSGPVPMWATLARFPSCMVSCFHAGLAQVSEITAFPAFSCIFPLLPQGVPFRLQLVGPPALLPKLSTTSVTIIL